MFHEVAERRTEVGEGWSGGPLPLHQNFTGDIGFNAVSMQYHCLGLSAMPEQSLSQHLQHDHWVVLLFVLCDTTSGRLLACCYSTKLQVTLGPFSPGRLLDSLPGSPPIPTSDPLEPSTSLPLQQVQVDFPASGYIDAHLSCHSISSAFPLTSPV